MPLLSYAEDFKAWVATSAVTVAPHAVRRHKWLGRVAVGRPYITVQYENGAVVQLDLAR